MKKIPEQTVDRTDAVSVWSSRITGPTRVLVGILFCALIYNPGQTFGVTPPATYSLTLAWNPSASPGLTACHVYYGTGTVDAGGSLEFTGPDAANDQQRFYRTSGTQP